ncbi:MAG: hypothetical protein ACP5N2_06670 [Candidatus Nanoarchaeia archaeon]
MTQNAQNNQSLEKISNELYSPSIQESVDKVAENTFGEYATQGAGCLFALGMGTGFLAIGAGTVYDIYNLAVNNSGIDQFAMGFTMGTLSMLALSIGGFVAGSVLGATYWVGKKSVKTIYAATNKIELPKNARIEQYCLRMFD